MKQGSGAKKTATLIAATLAAMLAWFGFGNGREVLLAGSRAIRGCPGIGDITITMTSGLATAWERSDAMKCLAKGQAAEGNCPLPEQVSFRSIDALIPIATALGDQDPRIRAQANDAFVSVLECNPKSSVQPRAEAAFRRVLDLPDETAQSNAIIGLGIVGDPGPTTLVLKKAFRKGGDAGQSRAAVEILTMMGTADAVPELASLLGKWDSNLQAQALDRLKVLGPEAEAAAPSIVDVLREGDTRLQDPAASAIAAICGRRPCAPHAAAAIVESFGRGPGPRDRDPRYQALGILADSAMPYLNAALGDARPQLRRQALQALGRLSEGWGPTPNDGKPAARRRVDLARLYCAGRETMLRIVAFLDDADGDLRRDAERTLQATGSLIAACPELRAALSRDASRAPVRREVVARLLAETPPRLWIASLDSVRIEAVDTAGVTPPRRADGGDTQAGPLTLPIELASSLSELGTVRLSGVITPEGSVSRIRILESELPEFARICESAVRNLRYVPGTVDGRKTAFPVVATCRSWGD